MVKVWLFRRMPDRRALLDSRWLRIFGNLLHDPRLWHLNRRSASGACAVGLFFMFMPPIGQWLMAAGAAIWLRVNLPLAVGLIFLSNPVTIPPIFYLAFVVGCLLLGRSIPPFEAAYWLDWSNWVAAGLPLAIGSLVCAVVAAALGWLAVEGLWRWHLARRIHRRRARYRAAGARRPSSSCQT
jgi:hypothetical protein